MGNPTNSIVQSPYLKSWYLFSLSRYSSFYDIRLLITMFKMALQCQYSQGHNLLPYSQYLFYPFKKWTLKAYLEVFWFISYGVHVTVPHLCGICCHLMPSLNNSIGCCSLQIFEAPGFIHFAFPHTISKRLSQGVCDIILTTHFLCLLSCWFLVALHPLPFPTLILHWCHVTSLEGKSDYVVWNFVTVTDANRLESTHRMFAVLSYNPTFPTLLTVRLMRVSKLHNWLKK